MGMHGDFAPTQYLDALISGDEFNGSPGASPPSLVNGHEG